MFTDPYRVVRYSLGQDYSAQPCIIYSSVASSWFSRGHWTAAQLSFLAIVEHRHSVQRVDPQFHASSPQRFVSTIVTDLEDFHPPSRSIFVYG